METKDLVIAEGEGPRAGVRGLSRGQGWDPAHRGRAGWLAGLR